MVKWELPPHAKNAEIKLVATEKIKGEIYLTFIGEDAEVDYCSLSEVENLGEKMQEYVSELLPKIKAGVYDIQLIEDV